MKIFLFVLAIFLGGNQLLFAQSQKEQVISLDSVFALADRNSTQIKLSKSALEIQEAAYSATKNLRLPSLEANVATKYYGDGVVMDRDFSNAIEAPIPDFGNDFSLMASYVVFAGRTFSTTIEKSELEVQIAALSHEKNRCEVRFLLTGHYLNLYKLYNQQKVFTKNIEQTEALIRQIKAKISAGMALDNDLTRYELMLQNLILSQTEIGNNIGIVNHHLLIALGLPEETVIIPDSAVQYLGCPPADNEEFLQNAMSHRQDIQIQALKKQLAEKNITLAKADLYPSVTLVGGEFLNGPITIEVPPIDKNFNYWFVGIALKYNIDALFKSKKNINVANSALSTAELAYQAELEYTQTTLHSAYVKYSESFDKLASYKNSYELARQNYSVIEKRYNNELALITEMLDASNMKLKAELQVVNGKLDVVYQYYKLCREMGTL